MSTPIDDGGPAFPQAVPPGVIGAGCGPHVEWGMTLRDWFAGQVLVGDLSNANVDRSIASYAEFAYEMADAMIAARGKAQP